MVGREGGTPGSSREHTNDDVSNVFKGTVGTGPMSQKSVVYQEYYLGMITLEIADKMSVYPLPSKSRTALLDLRSLFLQSRVWLPCSLEMIETV